jgi:GDP-L-fucose synthase
LRNKDYDGIRKDIQSFSPGFNMDSEKHFKDEISIKENLGKIGIHADYAIVWGSGEVYREFLYADDLADACIYLMTNCDYDDLGEIINIGTGHDITIKDLSYLLRDEVGFEGEIRFDLSKPDGTPKKVLDVSRIRGLGWKEKTAFREGIRKTYNWYRAAIRDERDVTGVETES